MLNSILEKYEKFPVKITSEEGESLKKEFQLVEKSEPDSKFSKSIRHKYAREINGMIYTLIVEYLFRENEFILDIKRAIGKNYYLNRRG